MKIKNAVGLVFFILFLMSCPKMKDDFAFDKWTKEKDDTIRYLAKVERMDFSRSDEHIVIIPTLEIQGKNVRFYLSGAMRVYTNFDSCLRYFGEAFDGYKRDFPVQIKYFDSDGRIVESEISDFNLPTDFYDKIKNYDKLGFSIEDIELKFTPINLKVSFDFCIPLEPLNLQFI